MAEVLIGSAGMWGLFLVGGSLGGSLSLELGNPEGAALGPGTPGGYLSGGFLMIIPNGAPFGSNACGIKSSGGGSMTL